MTNFGSIARFAITSMPVWVSIGFTVNAVTKSVDLHEEAKMNGLFSVCSISECNTIWCAVAAVLVKWTHHLESPLVSLLMGTMFGTRGPVVKRVRAFNRFVARICSVPMTYRVLQLPLQAVSGDM